jgi:polar amino acid transport system substrate-binding protein
MRTRHRSARAALAAVAVLAAIGMSACSNAGTAAEGAGMPTAALQVKGQQDPALLAQFPDSVRSSGVLRLAVDPNYPPSTFKDSSGQIVGIGPDLVEALRAKTGLRTEWVEVPFDGMLAGLQAHRFDVSWAGWLVTPERLQVLNLVTYLYNGTSVLVKAGNPAGITQNLDLCGRTVTAQTGTSQAQNVMDDLQSQCTAAGRPAITLMALPQQTNVTQAVATGRADAALASATAVGYQAKLQPDVFETVSSIMIQPSPVGIAVPKDDVQLANALAATFNALIADGTYADILARWDVSGSALPAAQVNPGAAG